MMRSMTWVALFLAASFAAVCAGANDADAPAALYKVQDGNKVDPKTLQGWKTWRALACERCHGAEADIPGMVVPKIKGQDRDYLIMALRAYRDDRRESSMMHKMSLPYSDSIIESLSAAYAAQPAK